MQILKSVVQAEVAKGGTTKEIAIRLNMSPSFLKEACKQFGISLRTKPREVVEFIDDTQPIQDPRISGFTANRVTEDPKKMTSITLDEEDNGDDTEEMELGRNNTPEEDLEEEREANGIAATPLAKVEVEANEEDKW